MSIATFHHEEGPDPAGLLRWVLAAVVVVAMHGGVVALINTWNRAEPPAGEPPPAMMIDLMPAGAPDVAATDNADPGPQVDEAPPVEDVPEEEVPPDPEPIPEPVPEPEPEPEPVPEPEPEPLPEPEPEPIEPIEPEIVETPVVPDPVVSLPPPPPPRPVLETKPKPQVKPKPEAKPKPKPEAKKQEKPRAQPRRTAPQSSQGQPGPQSAAPSSASGAASLSSAPPSWRSSLMSHINRHKRYPAAARQRGERGTAQVRFVIDRSGRVLSYRLAGTSGSALLDQEALATIQRASPFPPFPASVSGGSMSITVPLRFDLR